MFAVYLLIYNMEGESRLAVYGVFFCDIAMHCVGRIWTGGLKKHIIMIHQSGCWLHPVKGKLESYRNGILMVGATTLKEITVP